MRAGASTHTLAIREPGWGAPGGRRDINLKLVLDTLRQGGDDSEQEDESPLALNGKKRAHSERDSPPASSTARKRVKVEEDADTDAEPRVARAVYTHTFTFGLTTALDEENVPPAPAIGKANANELPREEEELVKLVQDLAAAANGPATIDIGQVSVVASGAKAYLLLQKHVARAEKLTTPADKYKRHALIETKRILVVPPIVHDDLDLEEHGFVSQSSNILQACMVLQNAGHASLTGTLALTHLQHVELEENELSVQLHLTLQVSLLMPLPHVLGIKNEIAEAQRRLLAYLVPSEPLDPSYNYSQTDTGFYYSVLKPAPPLASTAVADALQPDNLLPTLLPFQRRSLAVMLEQEGKRVDENGAVISIDSTPEIPLFWQKLPALWDQQGEQLMYYNRLTGGLSATPPAFIHYPGLFVAEEMGLGKTLECIALLLFNRLQDRVPTNARWDPSAEVDVAEVPTSLIVTPSSLAQQWVDECEAHAPSLRVFTYQGWAKFARDMASFVRAQNGQRPLKKANGRKGKKRRASGSDDEDADDMDVDGDTAEENRAAAIAAFFHEHVDVVVTTYNVLQQDLGVARAPVKRPRREKSNYSNVVERHRSPLICVEWGRLIMDEAQLVGDGKAAEMVSLIPRMASFAVSGTPAKANVADLYKTLKFIRVPDIVPSKRHWERLLLPGFAREFADLFSSMTVRTLKSQVKDELTIPPQSRLLVPIALGRVERHVYGEALDAALVALGVNVEQANADMEVDTTVLRSALKTLRGLCTHPQVGQLQRSDKSNAVLRSIGEVLEKMTDQTWREWMEDWRNFIQARTRHAQLLRKNDSEPARDQRALDILISARRECEQHVAAIQAALDEHLQKDRSTVASEEQASSKGKERALSVGSSAEDGGAGLSGLALEEYRTKTRAIRQRLREGYVVQHKVIFLLGDVYHALGPEFSQAEDASYQAAEELRKTLLRTTESIAADAMNRLRREAEKLDIAEADLEIEPCPQGGIRSADLMDEGNEIIDLITEQNELLLKWRATLVELLTTSVSSREQPADGEEYNAGLETQAQAEVYLQAYAALLADRREAFTSDRTILAAHENRDSRLRAANAAVRGRLLPEEFQFDLEMPEHLELDSPQQDVLLSELTLQRKDLRKNRTNRSLRMILVDLNRVTQRVGDRKEETEIARAECTRLRRIMTDQERFTDKFDAELVPLRRAFNERVQYFRQLQELSDTVAEVEWTGHVVDEIEEVVSESATLEADIRTKSARLRYLRHMAKEQLDNVDDEDRRSCILCKCEFNHGLITPCAHVFCEECITLWLKKGSKACPVCRVPVTANSMHRILVQDDGQGKTPLVGGAGSGADGGETETQQKIAFNMIDQQIFSRIQKMEAHGSYGSKIETLMKHLLYIQEQQPGAKSIVFSAWADSLHIIEHALITNGIPCLRVDAGKSRENAARKFRTDPHLLVFLLHGERENAGLNVTCAQRVFLVEPVVNHAFEVQAISRIDRMGQTHNTEVFCYFAEDTVEENILNLAARQGLSLYTEGQSHGTLDATAMVTTKASVDSPLKRRAQKGDFVAKADDMLQIMWPHIFAPPSSPLLPAPAARDRYTTPDAFTGNAIAGSSRVL
ncbi:hypothetical protein EXIGLDRAFT_776552 [Exidia glandulosa HHB12029]|uniref:RING-type domain-containing protein n=1 Tax=Exidia glandulosa HHB12029 TaxID=1314781 RepID=A0A165DFG6_EXIGL|nr:hypothetical protein EXIGLDRAFT_776552 [Exidia glandulosa HHB12029]